MMTDQQTARLLDKLPVIVLSLSSDPAQKHLVRTPTTHAAAKTLASSLFPSLAGGKPFHFEVSLGNVEAVTVHEDTWIEALDTLCNVFGNVPVVVNIKEDSRSLTTQGPASAPLRFRGTLRGRGWGDDYRWGRPSFYDGL